MDARDKRGHDESEYVKVGMIWAADAFGMSDNGAQRTDGVQISVANDP